MSLSKDIMMNTVQGRMGAIEKKTFYSTTVLHLNKLRGHNLWCKSVLYVDMLWEFPDYKPKLIYTFLERKNLQNYYTESNGRVIVLQM